MAGEATTSALARGIGLVGGDAVPPTPAVWILADGIWNDDGVWDDAAIWKDEA